MNEGFMSWHYEVSINFVFETVRVGCPSWSDTIFDTTQSIETDENPHDKDFWWKLEKIQPWTRRTCHPTVSKTIIST